MIRDKEECYFKRYEYALKSYRRWKRKEKQEDYITPEERKLLKSYWKKDLGLYNAKIFNQSFDNDIYELD